MLEPASGFDLLGAGKMASEFKQTLNEDQKEYAHALLNAVEAFTKLRATMPIQYVRTYLMVACDEGQGVTEYAKRAGVSQSVMTRHLLDIGERNRRKEEGFGLVYQKPDPMDLRFHRVFLTDDGHALFHQLMRAMRPITKMGK